MTALLAVLALSLAVALYLLASARAHGAQLGAVLQARDTELLRAREDAARVREDHERELQQLRSELEAFSSRLGCEREQRAALEERLAAERSMAGERQDLLQKAQAALADSFDALAGRALKLNNEQFLQLAKESLGTFHEGARGDLEKRSQAIAELVKPVQQSLEKVDGKIQQMENARAQAYGQLTQQVRSLLESQTALHRETGNLVKALRTPNVRGRWGEMQLQRVVEMAGMLEHCDFAQQETVQGEDGRLRPDLVVKLPGGKQLVVDAKAPLAAYLDALEAQDEGTRREYLASHARQLRNHVAQLARKAYWDQFEHTPEFVVLFVPNEAVFSAAMEQDPTLMEGAFSEKVLLASPTTLIALLRAAAFGWRQERLAQDAQEIALLGRDLHKRLARLGEHFAKVGRGLGTAVAAYNDTVGSFERMVVPGARKLRDRAAPMDTEVAALPDVELAPRELRAADPALPLPDDAN